MGAESQDRGRSVGCRCVSDPNSPRGDIGEAGDTLQITLSIDWCANAQNSRHPGRLPNS